jgi:hypothetical protein
MQLTIESTDTLLVHDGVECRLWRGTTEGGAPVDVLVHRVGAPTAAGQAELETKLQEVGEPAQLIVRAGEKEAMAQVRDLVLAITAAHEAICPGNGLPCTGHRCGTIAYLMHALGVRGPNQWELVLSLARDYDRRCADANCRGSN